MGGLGLELSEAYGLAKGEFLQVVFCDGLQCLHGYVVLQLLGLRVALKFFTVPREPNTP